MLFAFENLFSSNPGAAGALAQTLEIAARISQAIRMIHSERVNEAFVEQVEQQVMSRLEHVFTLDT